MKYYGQLLKKGCFHFDDVIDLCGGNINTAKSLLNRYLKKGYVKQVKRNLYVAISLETGAPVANVYQIATNITPTSYISHRSALAYYGYINQVSYELNVSSQSRFKNFEFEGMDYVCKLSDFSDGIIVERNVRVTDVERTIVDYVNDFDHIGGLEELLRGLEMMTYASSEKLQYYLSQYQKAILYQKTGYILEHFKESLKLEPDFFELCRAKKGKSIRYFSTNFPKEGLVFDNRWGLMVPENLLKIIS